MPKRSRSRSKSRSRKSKSRSRSRSLSPRAKKVALAALAALGVGGAGYGGYKYYKRRKSRSPSPSTGGRKNRPSVGSPVRGTQSKLGKKTFGGGYTNLPPMEYYRKAYSKGAGAGGLSKLENRQLAKLFS